MPLESAALYMLQPVELLVLQGTPFCNLNCDYCDLTPSSRRLRHVMPIEMIEQLFTQLSDGDHLGAAVTIVWHSGEPLTLPPSYYEEAITRLLRLRDALGGKGPELRFDFQTNGTLIDDRWCDFFERHAHHLNLGVSCDGPAELHDSERQNWAGRGTHALVLRGMELLEKRGIRYNAIAVITTRTLDDPEAFSRFFEARSESLTDFHFNLLASGNDGGQGVGYALEDQARYHLFFRTLLRLIREPSTRKSLKIRNFSQTLARIVAAQGDERPSYVAEGTAPLRQLNLDALGNVTTFYAGLSIDMLPDLYGDGQGFSLGNLNKMSLQEMLASKKLQRIMDDFAASTAHCASNCDYFDVCTGGFEIAKQVQHGRFDVGETTECVMHVKTLINAMLEDIGEHLEADAAHA